MTERLWCEPHCCFEALLTLNCRKDKMELLCHYVFMSSWNQARVWNQMTPALHRHKKLFSNFEITHGLFLISLGKVNGVISACMLTLRECDTLNELYFCSA